MSRFTRAIRNHYDSKPQSGSGRMMTSIVLLVMRLMVAKTFFLSGWIKLGYVRNNQLGALYSLFEDYKVPFLPVKVAAWMGMCGELGFSVLLALGLFARLGAFGIIVISAVIFHTNHDAMAPYWAVISALIVVNGPGKLAVGNITLKEEE